MLKKQIPKDPEESICEYINAYEHWECYIDEDFPDQHLIEVTKWKKL
jgi:hypothetical protein